MSPLLLLAGAGALLWALRRPRFEPHAPLGTVTLYAGVPYRMAIRSETGSGSAAVVTALQAAIREKLGAASGASAPTFLTIDTPPTWAPAGSTGWGRLLTVFDVTPARDEQTAVGRAVVGLGTIEWILRLDGQNFGDPPTKRTLP